MSVSALLLVAAVAAAQGQWPGTTEGVATSAVRPGTDAIAVSFDADQQDSQRTRTTPVRPHRFGIGGSIGASNRGAGGALRLWFGERVGVDFAVTYYRTIRTNDATGSTFAVLPSVIVMLTKPDDTRQVDVRPYVGGGVNYVRSTQPVSFSSSNQVRASGVGGQAFGGVELTFRDAQQVTVSAEGIYYRLPVRYINANAIDGFNYRVAVHIYLK